MNERESFQPISVKQPDAHPLLFWFRCFVDLQLATIVKHLRPALSVLRGSVLDVGAGQSPWRNWLPASVAYRGLDIVEADEFGMGQTRPDITYYDGRVMPFGAAEFDNVICIEVLEHAQNPRQLLNEISRVMKSGGVLLLTVPWSARRHHIPHDYQRFTREGLLLLLSENGFSDIAIAERGNDIGAIANKLTILTIRLIRPGAALHAFWTVPLGLLCAPIAAFFIFVAHCSDALGMGSKEDPLGYFVRARRKISVDGSGSFSSNTSAAPVGS